MYVYVCYLPFIAEVVKLSKQFVKNMKVFTLSIWRWGGRGVGWGGWQGQTKPEQTV